MMSRRKEYIEKDLIDDMMSIAKKDRNLISLVNISISMSTYTTLLPVVNQIEKSEEDNIKNDQSPSTYKKKKSSLPSFLINFVNMFKYGRYDIISDEMILDFPKDNLRTFIVLVDLFIKEIDGGMDKEYIKAKKYMSFDLFDNPKKKIMLKRFNQAAYFLLGSLPRCIKTLFQETVSMIFLKPQLLILSNRLKQSVFYNKYLNL